MSYLDTYDGDDRDGHSKPLLDGPDNGDRKRRKVLGALARVLRKA